VLFPNNDISNLVTLCRSCHVKRHMSEAKGRIDWQSRLKKAWETRRQECVLSA
jgi:5-methylcytosine-specific restriction endonuclease McrA